jgi:hypothetical protein
MTVTYVLPLSVVSIRVVEYVREDGSIPFKEWFERFVIDWKEEMMPWH